MFPLIGNINEVLPHIDDNFKVSEKEGIIYINYNHMMPEVFPDFIEGNEEFNLHAAIRRECRGIAFDAKSGEIISRPFHKFFNHSERVDSWWDLTKPHQVQVKLDGSMVRPIKHPCGTIRLATKAGVTEVAMAAEVFVAKNPQYMDFIRKCLSVDATPIFEYVGPHNRVVLEYTEDMTLLAIRDNLTGTYSYNADEGAKLYGIPYVGKSSLTLEEVKNLEDGEGVVVVYPNGHRVKVKSDWYVRAHKAKELLSSDRRFVESLVDNSFDDAYSAFLPKDKDKALAKFDNFSKQLERRIFTLSCCYNVWKDNFKTKKDFAVFSKDWDTPLQNFYRSGAFKLWDGKVENARQYVWSILEFSVSSKKNFDETMKRMEISFEY